MSAQVEAEEIQTAEQSQNVDRHPIVDWLEQSTQDLLAEIRKSGFWEVVAGASSDPKAVKAFMEEIYQEIIGYQPHVIEAAIAAIGQMPRSMDPRMVRSMLVHQADEFDHGEMARRDYAGMGHDIQSTYGKRMSPEAFAVAGVWWMIAQIRDPFMYLGALYLFEGLTPAVTGDIKSNLRAKGFDDGSLEYIEFHSTEDVKHANLVFHLISRVARDYPQAVESIQHGFNCFKAVYPLPLWNAAFRRAMKRLG